MCARRCIVPCVRRSIPDGPRQTEIEDLDSPVTCDEQVLRLQVAMDEPAIVRRAQPTRRLARILDGLALGQRARDQRLAQRFAFQQLDHGIRGSVVLAEIVDRQDVRVRQRRDGPSLPLETRRRIGIRAQRIRQHLDRHVAAQPRVARTVDLAHPAGAQHPDDLVVSEILARFQFHPKGF